jgi:alkanesulfonate monooxygenase SsuD/methylene tetrahydromethanopterin reductase-like flavin-dependent oxidoreductase (luciferase family)
MELALMTEPQLGGTHDDLLAAALWAESNGFVSFARSDHYDWGRDGEPNATDAFVSLGGLARETSTIRLAILVSPLTFRHPGVIAKSAATLDEMSGGRFDLGVGTGWHEEEHSLLGLDFPDWAERFARLEEALPYLHQALRAEHASFQGEYYSIDGVVRPLAPGVEFIVGGSGPKRTPRLAATWAEEYNTFFRSADELAARIAVAREESDRLGRDAIRCSVMGPGLVGTDEADYRERLGRRASERDMEPAELEGRLMGNGLPVGPIDRVAELLAGLEAVGVDRWYVQVIPHDGDTVADTAGPLLGLS